MADLTYEVPAAVAALDAPQPASGMSMARQTLNTVSLRNPVGGGKKLCFPAHTVLLYLVLFRRIAGSVAVPVAGRQIGGSEADAIQPVPASMPDTADGFEREPGGRPPGRNRVSAGMGPAPCRWSRWRRSDRSRQVPADHRSPASMAIVRLPAGVLVLRLMRWVPFLCR